MKTDAERIEGFVKEFEAAIIDRLAEIAKQNGGVYTPSAPTLRNAALGAMKEVCESQPEPVSPMLAVVAWEAVLKVNESAYRQHLEREAKAKRLEFQVGTTGRSARSIAAGYL